MVQISRSIKELMCKILAFFIKVWANMMSDEPMSEWVSQNYSFNINKEDVIFISSDYNET